MTGPRAGSHPAAGGGGTAVVDVAVVGGGPAGLSAGLWLGRYGRRVRVIDTSSPRNAPTWAVHGFPGLPDVRPEQLRARLLEQAQGAGAEWTPGEVVSIEGTKGEFRLETGSGEPVSARRILLAYGRRDRLPDVPQAEELYGTSLFHCPDCDGPSAVGARVGVVGVDDAAAALALFLSHWAHSVTLLANGTEPRLGAAAAERLERNEVPVRRERVEAVRSTEARLRAVVLAGGGELKLDCLFFHSEPAPACGIADVLGCACDAGGHLEVDRGQETSVPGVFAAGDLTGHPYLAVSAAAEGVRAALALHRSLLPAEFHL